MRTEEGSSNERKIYHITVEMKSRSLRKKCCGIFLNSYKITHVEGLFDLLYFFSSFVFIAFSSSLLLFFVFVLSLAMILPPLEALGIFRQKLQMKKTPI